MRTIDKNITDDELIKNAYININEFPIIHIIHEYNFCRAFAQYPDNRIAVAIQPNTSTFI